jgi:hypothetical protein
MTSKPAIRFVCLATLLMIIGSLASASTPGIQSTFARPTSRIVLPVDSRRTVQLHGNVHPLARPEFDKGLVDPSLPMDRMVLVLQRSEEQEVALEALMAEQQDPTSPEFHHWLSATELGERYGVSDQDLAKVTDWLQSQGFTVNQVSKGRNNLEFSGTAGQVQQAFQTEIHRYVVKGVEHTANSKDPQIPEALAPVVKGIASLHNFHTVGQSVFGRKVTRDPKTEKFIPSSASTSAVMPQFSTHDANYGTVDEDVTPYDFAAIYNVLPLWNAGIKGHGQTIAIAGVSDITISDVTTFQQSFGLTANAPQVIHNGRSPGEVNGGREENTLDVEWAGAVAPEASILLVVSASTQATGGDLLSDEYIVDNQIASIMSASYGNCELNLGTANNAVFNLLWQQGATEGISIFVSAGDQGSAGCDDSDKVPNDAVSGLQVNGVASSPYVTAVGGTDFYWQTSTPGTYWNSTNDAHGASAVGYIPEIPWNASCTNPLIVSAFGETTSQAACNDALTGGTFPELINIVGGSGGVSACTTPSGTTPASCAGGYPKPTWQVATGVPNDGKRDLPDLSLFAADGLLYGLPGSAYLVCVTSGTSTCDYSSPSGVEYQEVGGTSVSSPAMAGVMALVTQSTGMAQGLANPVLYRLAANESLAGCNSNTVASGNTCVFYDTTLGNNTVPCSPGTPDCTTSSGSQIGISNGYNATTGYDLATGLGSVNVSNLVAAWKNLTGVPSATPTLSVSPTSLTFLTPYGTTSAAQTVNITNTGTVAVAVSSISITGTNATSFSETNTCGGSIAIGASCTASVSFAPGTSNSSYSAVFSIADNAMGSPQTVALSGSAGCSNNAATPYVNCNPGGTEVVTNSRSEQLTFAPATVTTTTATAASTEIVGRYNGSIVYDQTFAAAYGTPTVQAGVTAANAAIIAAGGSSAGTSAPSLTSSSSKTSTASTSTYSVAQPQANTTVVTTSSVTTFGPGVLATGGAPTSNPANPTGGQVSMCTEASLPGSTMPTCMPTNPGTFTILAGQTDVNINADSNYLIDTATITTTTTTAVSAYSIVGVSSSPTLSISPTSLSFSAAQGSTSAAQTVTLTNTGTVAVVVTSISPTGTNASSFAQTSTCGASLAASASCTINVTFSPSATGSFIAALSIADNASGSPQMVTLNGNGTATPGPTATATAATSSLNPSIFGTSVTFTAMVTSATAGTIGGTATFYDNGVSIGTGAVISGVATFTTSTLGVGTHPITVTFAPATGSNNWTMNIAIRPSSLAACNVGSNPASPSVDGYIPLPAISYPIAVKAEGRYVYSISNGIGGMLSVIDTGR